MRLKSPITFPTTQWTLIQRAGDQTDGRVALAELLPRYLAALKAHLVLDLRIRDDDADDLLQGFVLDKIIQGRLIARADRNRGRFRTFLVRVLDNYVLNQRRAERAKSRRPAEPLRSLDPSCEPKRAEPSVNRQYDLAWAREILREALVRMRSECEGSGRAALWLVFEARVVRPSLDEPDALSYTQLIDRCGFATPTQAHNALITAKRTFGRILRLVIAEYAPGETAVEEELLDLKRIIAASA